MQRQSKLYFPLSDRPSSHLTIFTTICPLLSPSDPIDKSYFVPTFAVSFEVVYTGAGLILSKSRFRSPLVGVAEAPCRAHSRRMPDSPGSCGPLSGKSSEFPLHPWVNPCSSEHGKLCFRRPELFRASRNSSPQARTALYSEVVSRKRCTAEHVRKIFGIFPETAH